MRSRHCIVSLVAAALLLGAPSFAAASGFFGVSTPERTGGTPVTLTGRIVLENGQPVPGIELWSPPTPRGSGIMPGLPTIEVFNGVPAECFSPEPGAPSRILTDSQGRYRYTMRFHPEAEGRGRKCAEYRAQINAANATLVPLPTARYEFRRATGPLPMPRANLPGGAKATGQSVVPKGGFTVAPLR